MHNRSASGTHTQQPIVMRTELVVVVTRWQLLLMILIFCADVFLLAAAASGELNV